MPHISVLLYTTNRYQTVDFVAGDECAESICQKLCKEIQVTPASSLLFGLRIADSNKFLAPGRFVEHTAKYEFRMRFQVSFRPDFVIRRTI